jgi:hypothetical protein
MGFLAIRGDIAACAALVRADLIIAPRYSPVIELLPPVWARLLGQESFQADLLLLEHLVQTQPVYCIRTRG